MRYKITVYRKGRAAVYSFASMESANEAAAAIVAASGAFVGIEADDPRHDTRPSPARRRPLLRLAT
jgi:hypothetical protein